MNPAEATTNSLQTADTPLAENRFSNIAKQTAHRVSEAAQHTLQTVRTKADMAVTRGQGLVREKPMPIILGALAIGFAAGYVMAQKERPLTFRERYLDDTAHNAREALHNLLGPVFARLGEQYQGSQQALHNQSWANELRRMGSNLKFW